MSAKPESATTTSFEATTSQTPADVRTSLPATNSSLAATSTSVLLTVTCSEAPAANSSTVISSFVELSSTQSQTPIESQPIPSSSTPEPMFAPPQQPSNAASSSTFQIQSPVESQILSSSTPEPTFAPPQQPSDAASSSTFQIQSSVESQIPNSTFIQPLPSTALISSSPTAVSETQIATQTTSISSPPSSIPSAAPFTQSSAAYSPLASERLSQISSPIQLTSVSRTLELDLHRSTNSQSVNPTIKPLDRPPIDLGRIKLSPSLFSCNVNNSWSHRARLLYITQRNLGGGSGECFRRQRANRHRPHRT
jgi:hypothetical protein